MAFGTLSKVFTTTITDLMNNTTAMDGNSDTWNITLYTNTPTPDQTVASASAAYNVGQWITGSEATATGWPAGGLALASVTSTFSGAVYTFDAADKAGGASDTIADTRGCLIYDFTIASPVAKQALCYLSFGGIQSVTAGQLTVIFNASGIAMLTL